MTVERAAREWVIGREVELLGERVGRAAQNALDAGHLTRDDWDDPEAFAEDLQLYAAATLEQVPHNIISTLLENYGPFAEDE